MELLKQIQEPLILIASIITAITVVLGAYEKWWLKPREKRKEKERQKEHEEIVKIFEKLAEPFVDFRAESESDRKQINERVGVLEEDNYTVKGRVKVLEEKVGITTVIKYTEEY